jgi:hypothetical protein
VLAVDPNGGACLSFPGTFWIDIRTVKLSPTGETVWWAMTVTTPAGYGKPSFAAVSEDGGLYVAGLAGSLAFVARHDASGVELWSDHRPWTVFGGLGIDTSGRAILGGTAPGPKLGAIAHEPSAPSRGFATSGATSWTVGVGRRTLVTSTGRPRRGRSGSAG